MSSPLVIKRTSWQENETFYCEGLSITGKSHSAQGEPCQDYHYFEDLGRGWRLFVVSDGAGSAPRSQEGSHFMCEQTGVYIKQLISRMGWFENNVAPSELDWYIECRAVFSQLKLDIRQQISNVDAIKESDLSATILILISTPEFVLCGHIGDGRMGYRTVDGKWGSLMEPHKGDEPNQTVFVQSNWTYPQTPALRMHGVPVPETRVLVSPIDTIILMSDGCESFAWECDVFNDSEKKIETINLPFPGFLNPMVNVLDTTPSQDRSSSFERIINEANELCLEEPDDKTIIIARFLYQTDTDYHVESQCHNEKNTQISDTDSQVIGDDAISDDTYDRDTTQSSEIDIVEQENNSIKVDSHDILGNSQPE